MYFFIALAKFVSKSPSAIGQPPFNPDIEPVIPVTSVSVKISDEAADGKSFLHFHHALQSSPCMSVKGNATRANHLTSAALQTQDESLNT